MNERISWSRVVKWWCSQVAVWPSDHVVNRTRGYLLIIVSLIAGLVGGILMALYGVAMADSAATAKTLDRDLEPVIVTGAAVSTFANVPTDELFVYAYQDGTWTQIPSQVDEVTATGTYTDTEDGLLDDNDEVVFMVKDLGDQAPADPHSVDGFPNVITWYEIEVTDPISPTHKGWAYLVHSATLTPTFVADYVNFDTILHRINGQTYSLGYATPRPWIDYLTFNGSSVDLLDRTKTRLYCRIPIICPLTEDKGLPLEDNVIKDGPVRAIVRAGRVLAYGSMASWTTALEIPPLWVGDMRFSTDFSAAASGATFYSATVPEGVTVDGITDTVQAEPLSPWWQLSTNDGTLIQVSDTTPIGGTQSNYYVDDSTWDKSDTGDRLHYGDAGIYIANPNPSFTYTFSIYFLPGTQPNLGETYTTYFSQPLSVAAQLRRLELPVKVYLPLVLK